MSLPLSSFYCYVTFFPVFFFVFFYQNRGGQMTRQLVNLAQTLSYALTMKYGRVFFPSRVTCYHLFFLVKLLQGVPHSLTLTLNNESGALMEKPSLCWNFIAFRGCCPLWGHFGWFPNSVKEKKGQSTSPVVFESYILNFPFYLFHIKWSRLNVLTLGVTSEQTSVAPVKEQDLCPHTCCVSSDRTRTSFRDAYIVKVKTGSSSKTESLTCRGW